MKTPAIVRFKGARWEALAGESVCEPAPASVTALDQSPLEQSSEQGSNAKAILLDLAVRHFRSLQLTTTEARHLGRALRRCLKGEAVDVGPVGPTGRTYSFRRKVNAVAIRVGQASMRLPLDAARALIKPLQGAVSPRVFAKTG
ncbi:MAG: hypothetical protein WBN68_08835 [Sedimenticolaceae bacterium]